MASNEEVYWLYRCLLDRQPEDANAVDAQKRHDFAALRAAMMASPEFVALVEQSTRQSVYVRPRGDTSVALASIVRNEERNIEKMIRSCLSLVDYIVIVDTGSSDQTINIAKRVLEEEMPDRYIIKQKDFTDFSSARNFALEQVPSAYDWILMLDADEHIVSEDIGRFKACLFADVDAWHLPRLNFVDDDKVLPAEPYPDHQCRLFRNRGDIRFFGHVHERLTGTKSEVFAPANIAASRTVGGPHIHHMGQVGLTQEAWQRKHDFYTRLATKTGS